MQCSAGDDVRGKSSKVRARVHYGLPSFSVHTCHQPLVVSSTEEQFSSFFVRSSLSSCVSPAPYCPLSHIFKPNSPSRPVSIQYHPLCPHLCLGLLPHGLLTWCIHLLPHVEKWDNNRTIRRGGVAHSGAVVIFNESEITVWLKQHTLFYSEHHGCVQSKNPPRQQGGQRNASCSGLFCFLL